MPLIKAFLDRNSQINLSAIRDEQWVWIKHICDSIIWAQQVDTLFTAPSIQKNTSSTQTLLDVWTGGWFPLLPLAQHYPHIDCTGIDWRKKKIKAVNAIAKTIGLKNCHALWWRVEDHKKQYDIVTARAVAYIDTLLDRVLPRVKPGWSILLWKQFTIQEDADIHELMHFYDTLIVNSYRYELPEEKSLNAARNQERILYHIKK